ncbi:MAG: hypothetical protein H6697_12140 [Myxococcales bacterium]|nr:hypothetical protein [Myxococcales bacterium]
MIPVSALLLLQSVHGHLAVLAVALCYHPPVALRRARLPARGARWSAYLATGALTLAMVLGWSIYPEYRLQVRQGLYLSSRLLGKSFEVKEHLASFALALTWAGAAATHYAAKARSEPLTRLAARAYLAAALLATISAVLGIIITAAAGFDYGIEASQPAAHDAP